MGSDRLIKNIHYIVLLFTILALHGVYTEHEDLMEGIKSRKPSLEQEIKLIQQKLALAKSFQDDLEQSKQKLLEVTNDIEQIQRQLPGSIEDSEVLDLFGKEADQMNILDLSLKPGKEEKRDFYYAKDYELSAKGTFLQFLIYFERLANNSRLINVTELEMNAAKDDSRSRGRFQIIELSSKMEVFRYDPNYREDSGISQIESKFKSQTGKEKKK